MVFYRLTHQGQEPRWAFLLTFPLVVIAAVSGCAGSNERPTPVPAPKVAPVEFQSASLSIRLVGAVGAAEGEGTLARDPGWLEYLLEIKNVGKRPLTVHNVKLLTAQGRYLNSASEYGELSAPPDVATQVAGDIAVRSAGIAAGQFIPYGGAIVGILSGAASASSSHVAANARRDFALRRIKEVELAPGGRVEGSAFLPIVSDPKALVLDWGDGGKPQQVELPLNSGR